MQLMTNIDAYVRALIRRAMIGTWPNGSIVATVPDVPGIVACGDDPDECTRDLYEHLEDWVRFQIESREPLPVIDNIDLNTPDMRVLATYHAPEPRATLGEFFKDEEELEAAFASWRNS